MKWSGSCESFSASSDFSRQRSGSGPRYPNCSSAFRKNAGTSAGSFSAATRLIIMWPSLPHGHAEFASNNTVSTHGTRRDRRQGMAISKLPPPSPVARAPLSPASRVWVRSSAGSGLHTSPASPTTIRSSLATRRWVCFAGLPHCMQIASVLVMSSATASSSGIGSNGRPR